MVPMLPLIRGFFLLMNFETNREKCMEKIIAEYLQESNSLLFVTETNYFDISTKLPVIIITNFTDFKQTVTERFYSTSTVMVSKNYKAFTKQIEFYRNSTLWHEKFSPKGKLIIFFESDEDVREIFIYLWRMNVFKIVTIQNTILSTSFPFTNGSSCTQTPQLQFLGTCDQFQTIPHPKFPTFLNDCTARAAIFGKHIGLPYINPVNVTASKPGLLVEPLKLLTWKYGLNIVYDVQNDEMQELKPKIGTVGFKEFLYNGSMDLLVASPFLLPDIFATFDISKVIFYDRYVWLLHNPKPIPKNLLFTVVFTSATWLVLIITAIGTSFFYWKISSLKNENISFSAAIFAVYSFTIGFSSHRMPLSKTIRFLLFFQFVYSLHVVNIFQGRLNSILMKSVQQKRIDNVEEMADSELKVFFIYLINFNLLKNGDDVLERKLAGKSILLENITDTVDALMRKDGYVTSLFENSIYLTDAHKLQVGFFS